MLPTDETTGPRAQEGARTMTPRNAGTPRNACNAKARTGRRGQVVGRALASVGVALLLLSGPLASAASAHADVAAFSPAPAEVLDASPRSVKIWFTEGVDIKLGGVVVYDSNGDRVSTGDLQQPAPDRLVLPITDELADGSYIVTWRAISEDTHNIQGTWTFHVGSASATDRDVRAVSRGLLEGAKADPSVAIGWAIARWVVFASMALLVGGTAFASVIWPRARDARFARRVVTAGWIGLCAATVVGAALFGAYSAGSGLDAVVDAEVTRDIIDTRFGHVWLARLLLLGVAFVLLRVLFDRRPALTRPLPRWWTAVAGAVGAALVFTPGLAGHASTGDYRLLALLADGIHVGAMSVWLGGLVLLAGVVLRARTSTELRSASLRFSRVALWCVGALLVTGAFQTWRVVGGLEAFRDAEYGRILTVKLVVFAVMLVVASFSREITARAFPVPHRAGGDELPTVSGAAIDVDERESDDERACESQEAREIGRLRRSVWMEVGLGALVLVVTALLVNAAPPAGTRDVARESRATINARQVTLDIAATPGRAGTNDLHVNTYSPDGAPLDVDAVEVRISLPERDLPPLEVPLRELGPGHFLSPGLEIPLSGSWKIRATIRLGPVDRVDVTGDLEIAERTGTSP